MRVLSLIALSLFAACAAIAADNTDVLQIGRSEQDQSKMFWLNPPVYGLSSVSDPARTPLKMLFATHPMIHYSLEHLGFLERQLLALDEEILREIPHSI